MLEHVASDMREERPPVHRAPEDQTGDGHLGLDCHCSPTAQHPPPPPPAPAQIFSPITPLIFSSPLPKHPTQPTYCHAKSIYLLHPYYLCLLDLLATTHFTASWDNSSWKGLQEGIIPLYLEVVGPHLEYCAQSVCPNQCKEGIYQLKRVQCRAMATAGCWSSCPGRGS
ncbi:hypothetical protein QYF61_014308 [Mycteria americana]|uniref:Uncharacterized protein n=1 Tax=Mycteria americana TaxID=33587 RepID=A0AAN7PI23_MYCAM|nr:hypothetical protein QYF61_014308 [Mycteria americana]